MQIEFVILENVGGRYTCFEYKDLNTGLETTGY